MPDTWKVDSYHVNIGNGDCSIHLLVDLTAAPDTCARCVLVDGGSARTAVDTGTKLKDWIPLNNMIAWLSSAYTWPYTPTHQLQFDSIVLTHWDEDHYGQMLWSICQTANNNNGKIPYLKFGGGGEPLTYLYAPNWSFGYQLNGPKDMYQYIKIDDYGIGSINSNYNIWRKKASMEEEPVWVQFCQFRIEELARYNVMGVEFFFNTGINSPAASLEALAQANPPGRGTILPSVAAPPGLYCVGALQRTPASTGVGVVQGNPTLTNKVSLATVLYWTQSGKVSQYLAGDMDQPTEGLILDFLRIGHPQPRPMTAVKISHHGSKSSTPLQSTLSNLSFLQQAAPRNIILSIPSSRHMHPSWEVMWYIYLYVVATQLTSGIPPNVLGTKYPHIFAASPGATDNTISYIKAKRVSIDAFLEQAQSPYMEYWKWINAAVNEIGTASSNAFRSLGDMLTFLDEYHFITDLDQAKSLVLNQLERLWQTICHPLAQSHPSSGAGSLWPGNAQITQANQIDAIMVVSALNDQDDGSVYHKYRQRATLDTYNPTSQPALAYSTLGVTSDDANLSAGEIDFFPIGTVDFTNFSMSSAAVYHDPSQCPDPDESDPNEADVVPAGSASASGDGATLRSVRMRASAPPVAPLRVRAPPTRRPGDADDGLYFFASRIQASSIKVASPHILLANTPLDYLVSALHCANLCLQGPISGQVVTAPLQETDEFGTYMVQAQALQVSVTVSVDGADASVTGFSGGVAPFPNQAQDGGSALLFSTDAVQDAFAPSAAPPLGILAAANILIFGLDTSPWTTDVSLTLTELVTFAGLDYIASSSAAVALQAVNLTIAKKATGRRNAVWFEPLASYRATMRLEMDLDSDGVTTLNKYLNVLPGLVVNSASVIARKTTTWAPAQFNGQNPGACINYKGSLTFRGYFTVTAGGTSTTFDAAIELGFDGVKLILVLRTPVNVLASIFAFFKDLLSLPEDNNFTFASWFNQTAGNTSLDSPVLRRIIVTLADVKKSEGGATETSTPTIAGVQIDLETRIKPSGGTASAVFLITYTWDPKALSSSALTACLWLAPGDASALAMLPDYEDYSSLAPPVTLNGDPWPPSLDLTQIRGFDNLPSEIPHNVTQAIVSLDGTGISFSGSIMATPPPPSAVIPPVSLGELVLNASYTFGNSASVSASLLMTAMIQVGPGAQNGSPAQILGEVSYDSGTWKLFAQVHGIYGSALHDFFDSSSQSGIGSVLDNMRITNIGIEYDYKGGEGGVCDLAISGDIQMGSVTPVSLLLDFNYNKGTVWDFSAVLDTSGTTAPAVKLSDVLGIIFGQTIEQELPDFITEIPITPPPSADAAGLDLVSIQGAGSDGGSDGSSDKPLFFTAWINYDDVSFQAIQYQRPAPARGHPSAPPAPPAPLRVFTITVNKIPGAKSVPLIGELAQPFDEMLLVYVQPQPSDPQKGAITWKDMQVINPQLALVNKPALPYRVTKKTYQDSDILLAPGAHFLLVLKDSQGQPNVVLDYVFMQPAPSQGPGAGGQPGALVRAPPGRALDDSSSSPPDPGSAKAPYEKKIGPLTIRNMGFKYTGGTTPTLSIVMDASVVLGPIALDLLGFSLDLQFTKGTHLLAPPVPSVSLAGLAAAFDSPPVVLAGMLEHVVSGGDDYFEGAATVSFQPWLFNAEGYYGTRTTAGKSFTSAFVYFILDGPIITLEFGEVDQIMGGFGYNTGIKAPTAADVSQFPLLLPATAPTDPDKALDALVGGPWFFPQQGSYWVAAGLGAKMFEMLQVSLVVVVEWNPKVTLSLFGVATADLPAGGADTPKVVHAELGVVATVDFNAGTLKVDGQLAPSSWVLDPACHLTGGFAFYQWFGGGGGGGGAAGDFVFSVGGYHRSFSPPAQYPNPPRLAISWAYDSSLTITGEAYLAITPNVCMAGGRLDASMSLGPLSAWFDAYADLLLNYKPFHFAADGGVSVGVAFTLDLWICTKHISVEIGATLSLQGPPLAGSVYVDFWVFGFSIDFGDRNDAPSPALSLAQFYDQVLQAGLSTSSSAPLAEAATSLAGRGRSSTRTTSERDKLSSSPPPPVPHVFSCNEGLIPGGGSKSAPNDPTAPWDVRGAIFQFTVACKFAIDTATVVTGQPVPDPLPNPPGPFNVLQNGQSVYARPMHLTQPLSSQLAVTVTMVKPKSPQPSGWNVGVPVVTSVPNALWGVYSPDQDPLSPTNSNPNGNQALLHPDNSQGPTSPSATLVPLNTGVTLSSPAPLLSQDLLVPVDCATFFIDDAAKVAFPNPQPAAATWYPRPLGSGDEWEAVRTTWDATPGLGTGAAEQAVDLWAALSFAGWVVARDPTPPPPGVITGAPPAALLVDGVFQTLFIEAPRLVAVQSG